MNHFNESRITPDLNYLFLEEKYNKINEKIFRESIFKGIHIGNEEIYSIFLLNCSLSIPFFLPLVSS